MSRALRQGRLPRIGLIIALTGLLALLGVGCAELDPRERDDAPEQPGREQQKERTIRGVGSVTVPEEREPAMDEARTTARRNLAANIQSRVTGLVRDYVARSGGANSYKGRWREFGDLLASETAAQILQDLSQYSTWENAAGDTLFVEYAVKKQKARSTAAGLVPEMVQTVNPFGEEKQQGVTALTDFLQAGPQPEGKVQRPQNEGSKPAEAEEEPETQVPAWLSKGPYEVHAFKDYTAEVAVGDDREQAEEAARRAVVESLTVRMRSEASRLSRSAGRQELAVHVERLPRRTISYSPEAYAAPRITHSWYDNRSAAYYALAALERASGRQKAMSVAISAAEAARKPLENARRQRDNGRVRAALESYVKAVKGMRRGSRAVLAGLAVSRSAVEDEQLEELTQNLALKEADAELSRLVASLSAEAADGNLHWVSPGARPSVPLAAKVTAGPEGASIGDVPVQFRRKGGPEEWRETVRTDSRGIAALQPPALEGEPGDEVSFVAALSPAALVDDVSDLDISAPQARFHCLLRSREGTRFSVHVRERSFSGTPVSDPVLAATLNEALTSSNFRLQRLSGLSGSGGVWSEEGELRREKLASVARATATVEGLSVPPVTIAATCRRSAWNSTETSQGTLYFVTAHVKLWLLDPAFSGDPARTLATIDVREQGAYTEDRAEAYRQARRKAAETCAQKLTTLLQKRFQ